MNLLHLTDTLTIVVLSVLWVILLIAFAAFRRKAGGKYLDEVVSRLKSQEIVNRLDPNQVATHVWVTCLLDTAFPACYGLCLASIIFRFAETDRIWVAFPIGLTVVADYLENVTHLTALRTRKVPYAKPIFSIVKWVFFVFSAVIALSVWGFAK